MKKYLALAALFVGLSSQAHAGEYLVNKMEYISGLGASCDIKVYKGITMDVSVVCGTKGQGNCSGHKWDDYFSCRTGSGSSSSVKGVPGSINWILNNL